MLYRYFVFIFLSACLLAGGSSCKKMLDVESSRLVGEGNMWKTVEDARAGLIGVYGLMRAALCDNDRHWIYGDVRTVNGEGGDFRSVTRLDLKAITGNNLLSAYPVVQSLCDWSRFYAVVNAANIFIEHAPDIVNTDKTYLTTDLKLDMAHARYLRALAYFYMVRIWGDVPLIVSSHDGDFVNKPRDDWHKVLAFVESELLTVAPELPVVYDKGDPLQTRTPYYNMEEEIAKRHTAYAILAHAYAWEGKYADAAKWAQWVLDNMQLSIMDNQKMFFMNIDQTRQMFRGEYGNNQYNIIAGFSHQFYVGESGSSGFMEELTLAAPYVSNKSLPAIYVPKDSVFSIFNQSGDTRFAIDTLTSTPNSDRYFGAFDNVYPIFTKVFIIRDNNPPLNTVTGPGSDGSMIWFGSSIVLTRPAEMKLLLAEAKVVLGDNAGAVRLLNEWRTGYRGLKDYNPEVDETVLDAIFSERRKEFMGEGWRWYDYVRFQRIKNNPEFNILEQSGGIYWPIASKVMAQNGLLKQYSYWNK